MITKISILAVLIVLSSIFSGSETALVSLSKSKVDELVSKKAKNSKILQKLKNNPHRLLITVLIGNNIVNIAASGYAAIIFTEIFGSNGVGIATGIMTLLILIFGEITPKAFAHQHAIQVSLLMARPVYFMQIFFFPFVWFFDRIVDFVNNLTGNKQGFTVTEGELVAMLKIGAKEGAFEKQEREFIENVLEFNDIEVKEVMTPRVNIEALDIDMTIQDAVDFVIKHSHTRYPVYDEGLDDIVGILSIKDLLKYFDEFSPRKKLRNLDLKMPLEVPLSKKIDKLFRDFQRRHVHLAIVIDEYGGTAGLVTLEDLLEEIVGDIVDEYDIHQPVLEVVDKKSVIARGDAWVEDINDHFKINLWKEERSTLNNMIVNFLHRFPREGEEVLMPRARIQILKMNENIVEEVKITKVNPRKK